MCPHQKVTTRCERVEDLPDRLVGPRPGHDAGAAAGGGDGRAEARGKRDPVGEAQNHVPAPNPPTTANRNAVSVAPKGWTRSAYTGAPTSARKNRRRPTISSASAVGPRKGFQASRLSPSSRRWAM